MDEKHIKFILELYNNNGKCKWTTKEILNNGKVIQNNTNFCQHKCPIYNPHPCFAEDVKKRATAYIHKHKKDFIPFMLKEEAC